MRGTRHSEEQIIAILKQADNVKTAEICRQHGIAEQTLYRWKAKYGGMDVSDAKKLKHVAAELTLDNRALKDAMGRNW